MSPRPTGDRPSRRPRALTSAAAGFGVGMMTRQVGSAVRSATMSGSTIAAPAAAGWVTDFLNAAYYARPSDERTIDDLRLGRAILTTYWHRQGHRRLGLRDLPAFHRAFGRARFRLGGERRWATLTHPDLLTGGDALLGPWFRGAWATAARRGWGVVFEDEGERAAFQPEVRLAAAALGPPSPPSADPATQAWHTYAPVPVRSIAAAREALLDASRWPDYGSALGSFTPLRSRDLVGQTFEIEIVLLLTPRTPVMSRGYVTATALHDAASAPDRLEAWVRTVDDGLASRGQQPSLPAGARPLVGLELTTHEGHFMGAATSNILLFEQDGQGYLRDTGRWDPMPWHLDLAYRNIGVSAQQAFWGGGAPDESMLHQFAAA
jgi:hypothetical protein